MTDLTDAPVASYGQSEYETAVVNSSLWATAGDALGWITELSHGVDGVRRRTGKERVTEPVTWRRHIGGKSGVNVDLPVGAYSDDTQLRLCVSRSIRGTGVFDVEAFAKVEVTSWQGYCLGAGIGSKAAAKNLSKRTVNWYTNFFSTDRQKYTKAGGNGAAMRIQPHVWSASASVSRDEMLRRVMSDAIVTHGHPHGFCGAVFHALCIWHVLREREIPSIEIARGFVSELGRLPDIFKDDPTLPVFWMPAWERESGWSFEDAIGALQKGAFQDIALVKEAFETPDSAGKRSLIYHDVLERLGCLSEEFRGSGFKTALAALALSLLYSPKDVADALVNVANELGSDTDTIATMSGALLGTLAKHEPEWKIQDIEYLRSEAIRMANIARGASAESHSYPDVSCWRPPRGQSDAVGMWNGNLALKGIGVLEPQEKKYISRTSVWQWFRLTFGQSILAKRRLNDQSLVDESQMPSLPLLSVASSTKVMSDRPSSRIYASKDKQNDNEHFDEDTGLQTSTNERVMIRDASRKEVNSDRPTTQVLHNDAGLTTSKAQTANRVTHGQWAEDTAERHETPAAEREVKVPNHEATIEDIERMAAEARDRLQEKSVRLRTEVDMHRATLEETSGRLRGMNDEVKRIQDDCVALMETLATLEGTIHDITERIQQFSSRLEAARNESQRSRLRGTIWRTRAVKHTISSVGHRKKRGSIDASRRAASAAQRAKPRNRSRTPTRADR